MAKDLFSKQSDLYARYRPSYPSELFDHILSFVNKKDTAWDCATGNGQAAAVLAEHFKKVMATDISQAQLDKAVPKENIEYLQCPAESTPFPENSFDLITVAQAYHWLKWDAFKTEATRVAKPGAVIAAWMYDRTMADEKVNEVTGEFYKNITGPYWDYERKYVDDKYAGVDFDYELLPSKEFQTVLQWNRNDLLGYVSTWSAVQKYIKENGQSPVPILETALEKIWPANENKKVVFPVYLKLGRIRK